MKDELKIFGNTFRTQTPIPSELQKKLQKSLPILPGHQFNLEKEALSHHRKSHAFDYCNSVAVFKKEAPGIGGQPLPGQDDDKIHTSVEIYPNFDGIAERVPAWVAFDRKVLRFYAYFQEAVHERREEQYRIRRVNIYFYLEDDTIHVSEPKQTNSGIPQGTLIRRHRIPKPNAKNDQHYIVSELTVGSEIPFYGRTFKIVGCDKFTRDFLSSNGLPVEKDIMDQVPVGPYEACRQELLDRMKPTRAYNPKTSLKRFLENDRSVLRFYCVWDDTNTMFGDVRHMVLHYYLSDGTIEIREFIPANSGRETNTLFLRRCRLPKKLLKQQVHGGAGAGRAGAAAGGGGGGEEDDTNPLDFYNESDLILGSILHLYGRPFIICDCDTFTKDYYKETYGLENFDPVSFDESSNGNISQEQLEMSKQYERDVKEFALAQEATSPSSLIPNILMHSSTKEAAASMIPAPQKFDLKKMILFDGVALRYGATLISKKQIDKGRKFVISLYPADNTISIFEPRQRNSGILGGKFMEKGRALKPGTDGYYSTLDFYIGSEITLHGHKFKINEADDFAEKFMLKYKDMFTQITLQSDKAPASASQEEQQQPQEPEQVVEEKQKESGQKVDEQPQQESSSQ